MIGSLAFNSLFQTRIGKTFCKVFIFCFLIVFGFTILLVNREDVFCQTLDGFNILADIDLVIGDLAEIRADTDLVTGELVEGLCFCAFLRGMVRVRLRKRTNKRMRITENISLSKARREPEGSHLPKVE